MPSLGEPAHLRTRAPRRGAWRPATHLAARDVAYAGSALTRVEPVGQRSGAVVHPRSRDVQTSGSHGRQWAGCERETFTGVPGGHCSLGGSFAHYPGGGGGVSAGSSQRRPRAERRQRDRPRVPRARYGSSSPRVRALVKTASAKAGGQSSALATTAACEPGAYPSGRSLTSRRKEPRNGSNGEEGLRSVAWSVISQPDPRSVLARDACAPSDSSTA